jgi:hypothetical protein
LLYSKKLFPSLSFPNSRMHAHMRADELPLAVALADLPPPAQLHSGEALP